MSISAAIHTSFAWLFLIDDSRPGSSFTLTPQLSAPQCSSESLRRASDTVLSKPPLSCAVGAHVVPSSDPFPQLAMNVSTVSPKFIDPGPPRAAALAGDTLEMRLEILRMQRKATAEHCTAFLDLLERHMEEQMPQAAGTLRSSDTRAVTDRPARPRSRGGCPPRHARGWSSDCNCLSPGSQTTHSPSAVVRTGTPPRRRPTASRSKPAAGGRMHCSACSSLQGGEATLQLEGVARVNLLARQARAIPSGHSSPSHPEHDTPSVAASSHLLPPNAALSGAACGFYEMPRSISRSPSNAAPSPSRPRRQQRQHRRGQSYGERPPTAKSMVFGNGRCTLTSSQSSGEVTGSAAASVSPSPLGRHGTHHGVCKPTNEGGWSQWE